MRENQSTHRESTQVLDSNPGLAVRQHFTTHSIKNLIKTDQPKTVSALFQSYTVCVTVEECNRVSFTLKGSRSEKDQTDYDNCDETSNYRVNYPWTLGPFPRSLPTSSVTVANSLW